MNIETKFNKGDHAWYMKDNKPIEVIISAIHIFHVGNNQDYIKYNAKDVIGSVSWLDHQNLFESMAFKTKGELFRSLFGSDRICKGKNCSAVDGIGHSAGCIQEHESHYAEEIPGFEGTRKALNSLNL